MDDRRPLRRIAIINRGEPAMRLIHAARELSHDLGEPVRTIALHTDAERGAMFVREADEAVRIGPRVGEPAATVSPYIDYDVLEQAMLEARADAAWVGWGFVAEHAAFADLCERIGVTFVGPPGEVMRQLGDKIGAKRLAEQAGVPVAAWSNGPVADAAAAREQAARIGYPLMIKAAAGGGGRGIRKVSSDAELALAFDRARDEARKAFGDDTMFMERVITGARHIEVQIIADGQGGVWAAGVRDCSVQRRNQKVIEESSSTALDADQDHEVREAAANLARIAGYRNAGTVEFLYQPQERTFAFLEVNTRLQVEHPVTELTTGIDLVKLQLLVAGGGTLEGDAPPTVGHAIEVRLNAEDPERGFAPAPGTIELLSLPSGPGIRVDTGVSEGDVIPPEYDSMIAKIIGWGRDRHEAMGRLSRALGQTTVLIRGGTTNRAFLLDLLRDPAVVAGTIDTAWLDRLTADGGYRFTSRGDLALVAAAVDAANTASALERDRFYASASRGRPQVNAELRHTIDLRYGGTAYRFEVAITGTGRYLLEVDGHQVLAKVEHLRRFESRLTVGSNRHRIVSIRQGPDQLVEVDGIPHRISQDDAGLIRAPGPSVVVAITAELDDVVEAGSAVAVLESMKMETVLTAPFTGRVREVMAGSNVQLDAGAPVLRLEPIADEATTATTERLSFEHLPGVLPAADMTARCHASVAALRRLVLGFDVPVDDVPTLLDHLDRALELRDDAALLRAELTVLRTFSDLASLSRNRRIGDEEDLSDRHSAREYLHAYLRSLDVEAESLPASFVDKLRRALAHYGIDSLDRTPDLEDALYRIHLAQQRAASHLPAILALLGRRMQGKQAPDGDLGDELRETLDRLILATQVRHPPVGDLARRARYRCFDQPRIKQERDRVYAEARDHLTALADDPTRSDRAERITALVNCPQPLLGLLEHAVVADGGVPPLLEVLTHRYYRTRQINEVRPLTIHGRSAVVAEFTGRLGEGRVVAIASPAEELSDALRSAAELSMDGPVGGAGAVADIYISWPDAPAGSDVLAAGIEHDLNAAGLPEPLRRVTLSVTVTPGDDLARPAVEHLTYRRGPDGFTERRHLRGIHPLIAGRLDLWRFEHFELTRLRSSDDVYLFDAVARDQPTDRRLFAMAEVRDLTPTLDADGTVTAMPELEQVLATCLDDLRQARAMHPPGSQPDWNRVMLNVWPVVDIPIAELHDRVRAVAAITEGLGLEQVHFQARFADPDGHIHPVAVRMSRPPGQGFTLRVTPPPTEPLKPFDATTQKVQRARRRGTVYPYELVPLVARTTDNGDSDGRSGRFVEHDLNVEGLLAPVDRPYGGNSAGIVVGLVTTPTDRYPEGMTRVALFGDPTKGLGSIAEPECRRIIAALDLAETLSVPVEWFAVSSGARIAMDSGTENMDWVGRVLKRIIEFTQDGGEINVVVAGINVGAQPYWNAEATMLMHTKGILIMTPDSAMVLTGKQALDYSGGVSAEDNYGIGGYDRVMGPNGQAQHWAPDLGAAIDLLFAHYGHTYVAPGERFPRRATTADPIERDVRPYPHVIEGIDFTTVGDIFDESTNPGRKKPFDIRTLMRATIDQDHAPLERWADMADAEVSVVFDAHLGGYPVTLLGIESRSLPRRGPLPADGPEQWTAGTLFPRASKKTARAINAASGNRPVVVLANLSGFDGSPESLRSLQLEYGAEIGRAVVNFDGPIVFCVVSRYHGGAFVVFSATLNDQLEVAAVEGSHASVIGGPPAAAVVFAGDVNARTARDPRVRALEDELADAPESDLARLRAELDELRAAVHSEKLGEVAAEFDAIHSVERAREVGSVDTIVAAERLRPYLVEAIERGMRRT